MRWFTCAALATALAVGTVSPTAADPDTRQAAGAGATAARGLFVVGDSLTVGSRSTLQSDLSRQFAPVTIDAEVGRNTPTGVSRLTLGEDASVWVVALGTNDAPSVATMRSHVRTVLRRAGSRKVLWVSVWRSPAYRKVNRMLSRQDTRSVRLTVLRWDRFIRKNRHLLAADGIHLTPAGYQIRGHMIAQAVTALA